MIEEAFSVQKYEEEKNKKKNEIYKWWNWGIGEWSGDLGPLGLFLAVSPGKPGHTYVIKVLLIQHSVLSFMLSKVGSLESAEEFIYIYIWSVVAILYKGYKHFPHWHWTFEKSAISTEFVIAEVKWWPLQEMGTFPTGRGQNDIWGWNR